VGIYVRVVSVYMNQNRIKVNRHQLHRIFTRYITGGISGPNSSACSTNKNLRKIVSAYPKECSYRNRYVKLTLPFSLLPCVGFCLALD
jgi:hypothetical protein